MHVVKRAALKRVLGFYTDYAASFDKELRLAVNICEVQHFKKIKRRKRVHSQAEMQAGISRLLGQFENSETVIHDDTQSWYLFVTLIVLF